MSYAQHMKWTTKHRKGTRQPMIMSTGSGFWPSSAYIKDCYLPYAEACAAINVLPIKAEAFYRHITTTKFHRDHASYAAMTKAGHL